MGNVRVGRPTRIRPEASGRRIHPSGEVSVREVGPTTGKASSGFPGEAFSVGALDERGGSRCLNLLSVWELHILSCARTPLCQACGGHCTWQGGCAEWSCSSCSECPFGCYEAICSPFNRDGGQHRRLVRRCNEVAFVTLWLSGAFNKEVSFNSSSRRECARSSGV